MGINLIIQQVGCGFSAQIEEQIKDAQIGPKSVPVIKHLGPGRQWRSSNGGPRFGLISQHHPDIQVQIVTDPQHCL
jgi:hypothetical protein